MLIRVTAVILGSLLVIWIVSLAGRDSSTPSPTGTVSPPVSSVVVAESGPPSQSTSKAVPGDGTFMVGRDIQSGTYRAVPDPGVMCYWERLRSFAGGGDNIIANETGYGPSPMIVTIESSDVGFKTTRCNAWIPIVSQSLFQKPDEFRQDSPIAAHKPAVSQPSTVLEDAATLTVKLKPGTTLSNATRQIAARAYPIAVRPGINKVTVLIEIDGSTLVDRYGNRVPGDVKVGEVVLEGEDLAELRKFKTEQFYLDDQLASIPYIVALTRSDYAYLIKGAEPPRR